MRQNTIKIINKAIDTCGKAFFDCYYDHPSIDQLKAAFPEPVYKVFYSPNKMRLCIEKA